MLVIAALACVHSTATYGQVNLTDITVWGTDTTGIFLPGPYPDIWHTRAGGDFSIWIQAGASGGPFLNGPTDSAAQPNISLAAGANSFRLLGYPGADFGYFGINLFFNGSTTPSISALVPMSTSLSPTVFSVDGNATTAGVLASDGPKVPGAGTLAFTAGNQQITLTGFYWATPSVYGIQQAGPTSTGAAALQDYVGGITLNVTTVPEPQVAMFGAAFLTMLAFARRTFRSQRG